MSLKRKIATVLVAGVLSVGAMLAVPMAASATGNPAALDQGDLTLACQEQQGAAGWQAKLKGSNAYSWKCVYNNQTDSSKWKSIDVNAYCMAHWGVWAAAPVVSNPYSWKCQ